MSMQTSASVPDQQDDAMPDLFPMGQFIATMDRSIQYSELPKTCNICWEDYNWDDSVVMRLPCDHIFHEECCLNWMNSTLENRNACPICRTVSCLHNVLTLEREDSMSDSEEGYSSEVMAPYDRIREAYHWIHAAANDLYVEEWWKGTGSPDYVSIIRETRIQWHREHHHQPYEFICDEHEEVGDSWLELVVANRVREKLSEDGLADSLEGQAVERRRNQLVSWVNQDSDPESEVWVPQNMQEFEERAAERGAGTAVHDEHRQQEQHDDDRQAGEDSEEYERWASGHPHEDEEGSEEGEIREQATRQDPSELAHPESFEPSDSGTSPTDSGTTEHAIIAQNDAIHRRFQEEIGAQIVVGALPDLFDFRRAGTPPLHGEVQRRRSRSQSSSLSSPSPSTDPLFPLPAAASLADPPSPQPTVSQRDVANTRSWLRSEGHMILCEMHNVASVVYRGDHKYDVRGFGGDDMGVVRDADAYHVAGWITIFYRYGGDSGDFDGSRERVRRGV